MNDRELQYLGELTAYAKVVAQCLAFLAWYAWLGTMAFVGGWHTPSWLLVICAAASYAIAFFWVARVKYDVHNEQHPKPGAKPAPAPANASYNPDGCDGSQEYE